MKYKLSKLCRDGLVDQNPTLVQFLGMCATLAVTTLAVNAIGMGLATTFVLICSNLFIALLRKWIPSEVRIAAYIVVISTFVTIVDLVMKAYFPSLSSSLGLFIPLIVVNCIIFARAEAFASKNTPADSFFDGLFMGLGFTLALLCVAVVREILGNGTIFGFTLFSDPVLPIRFFQTPAGAFITLGLVAAAMRAILNARARRKAPQIKE